MRRNLVNIPNRLLLYFNLFVKYVGSRDHHAVHVLFKSLKQLTDFSETWCERNTIGDHTSLVLNFLQSIIT
jgi:hypothetical protein